MRVGDVFEVDAPGLYANVSNEFSLRVSPNDRAYRIEAMAEGLSEVSFRDGNNDAQFVLRYIVVPEDAPGEIDQWPSEGTGYCGHIVCQTGAEIGLPDGVQLMVFEGPDQAEDFVQDGAVTAPGEWMARDGDRWCWISVS